VAVAYGAYHVLRANLLKADLCELSNYQDELQVVLDVAHFREEDYLFEWSEYVSHKVRAVHFDITWKSVTNIEAAGIHMIVSMNCWL
jgi:predicted RNA-binding protein Jag